MIFKNKKPKRNTELPKGARETRKSNFTIVGSLGLNSGILQSQTSKSSKATKKSKSKTRKSKSAKRPPADDSNEEDTNDQVANIVLPNARKIA
jgi:hypothetical protein